MARESGSPVFGVEGITSAQFEPVIDEFAGNFSRRGDVGAALCVYHRGEPVVDLWAGTADRATGRRWAHDTPVLVFSLTKGITAICVHMLVEAGVLDVDAPVTTYWPEFAAAGKDHIPLRWVLSQRAGVAAVDSPVTLDDIVGWDGVVAAVAAQAPNWEPGTAHGYHARTFGWMLGEVVLRVTGVTLGSFFATEVAKPLGVDFWIGLPEEIEPRLARIIPPDPPDEQQLRLMGGLPDPASLMARVMSGPNRLFAYDERWNGRALHQAEMPSSNGVTTAAAAARVYAATIGEIDGVRLLAPATVDAARVVQSDGPDLVLGLDSKFGLGFALPPFLNEACAPTAFGHGGAGGSLAFADPESELAFAYVMNRMRRDPTKPDTRATALVAAVYECLIERR